MKNTLLIVGIIAVVLGVGFIATSSDTQTTPQPSTTAERDTSEETLAEVPTEESKATIDFDNTESNESTNETLPSGTYQDYDAARIAASDADRIFLSFYATWCPSCRALEADIQANAADIPPGVEIYKVDFDTATDLKREYGVTVQHSIIEIDSDGIAKSNITHPATLTALLAI